VLTALQFQPAEADFGRRVVGSDGSADVVIRYELPADREPFELVPRASEELPLTWSLGTPEVTDLAGRVRQVKVAMHLKLDGSRPLRPFRAALLFESKLHRPARLNVFGEVHPGWYLERWRSVAGPSWRTTTSCPSVVRARLSSVPMCPDPPGITIFI